MLARLSRGASMHSKPEASPSGSSSVDSKRGGNGRISWRRGGSGIKRLRWRMGRPLRIADLGRRGGSGTKGGGASSESEASFCHGSESSPLSGSNIKGSRLVGGCSGVFRGGEAGEEASDMSGSSPGTGLSPNSPSIGDVLGAGDGVRGASIDCVRLVDCGGSFLVCVLSCESVCWRSTLVWSKLRFVLY